MSKLEKIQTGKGVSLPAYPWVSDVLAGDDDRPNVRGGVVLGTVDLDCVPGPADAPQGSDEEVVQRRARVWRVKLPPMLDVLNAAARAAVMDYIAETEAVQSSGSGGDLGGGGGGSAGSKIPNERALLAATRLRAMHKSLEGGEMVVPNRFAAHGKPETWQTRTPLRQLIDWVALDGLSRSEILRRANARRDNETAQLGLVVALVDAGHRLAVCCSYEQSSYVRPRKTRNTPAT